MSYYWTVDGVPACISPHTWGPDINPPFACAGEFAVLAQQIERFDRIRPGHTAEIHLGRCPESGQMKWERCL